MGFPLHQEKLKLLAGEQKATKECMNHGCANRRSVWFSSGSQEIPQTRIFLPAEDAAPRGEMLLRCSFLFCCVPFDKVVENLVIWAHQGLCS